MPSNWALAFCLRTFSTWQSYSIVPDFYVLWSVRSIIILWIVPLSSQYHSLWTSLITFIWYSRLQIRMILATVVNFSLLLSWLELSIIRDAFTSMKLDADFTFFQNSMILGLCQVLWSFSYFFVSIKMRLENMHI